MVHVLLRKHNNDEDYFGKGFTSDNRFSKNGLRLLHSSGRADAMLLSQETKVASFTTLVGIAMFFESEVAKLTYAIIIDLSYI